MIGIAVLTRMLISQQTLSDVSRGWRLWAYLGMASFTYSFCKAAYYTNGSALVNLVIGFVLAIIAGLIWHAISGSFPIQTKEEAAGITTISLRD